MPSQSPCFIYAVATVIRGCPSAPVKIGVSSAPAVRLRELQTGSPHKLTIVFCAMLDSRDRAVRMERHAHEDAAPWAMAGEWFDIEPGYAVGLLAAGLVTEHGHGLVIADDFAAGLQ